MLDMLATTRVLTEAGFDAHQAQAITAVAMLQAEIARSEVRLIRWMFAAVGLAVALLRLLG